MKNHLNPASTLVAAFNPFEPNQGTLRCIIHDGIEQVDTSDDAAVSNVSIKSNAIGGQGVTNLSSLIDESENPDVLAQNQKVIGSQFS